MRTRRGERGWTQAERGDRAGVSRQTINAIEAGRYVPSLPLAFTLARIFDEPIESLFHPAEDAPMGAGDACNCMTPTTNASTWQGRMCPT